MIPLFGGGEREGEEAEEEPERHRKAPKWEIPVPGGVGGMRTLQHALVPLGIGDQ